MSGYLTSEGEDSEYDSDLASDDEDKDGLTLPGYKYLGPFNSLKRGPPVNRLDEIAQRHDFAYARAMKRSDDFVDCNAKMVIADAKFVKRTVRNMGRHAQEGSLPEAALSTAVISTKCVVGTTVTAVSAAAKGYELLGKDIAKKTNSLFNKLF